MQHVHYLKSIDDTYQNFALNLIIEDCFGLEVKTL